MRALVAILLAVVLAGTASARTIHVRPNGSNIYQGAFDGSDTTAAHALSLDWFNANAVAGDTCHISWGSYNTPIVPARDGTNAARIVYVGDVGSRGQVILPYMQLDSTSTKAGQYICVRGVTLLGEAIIGTRGFYHARWDSITWSDLRGGLTIAGGYTFIEDCSIGDGTLGDRLVLSYGSSLASVWPNLLGAKRNEFRRCTINLQTSGNTSTNFEVRSRDSLYMGNCRLYARIDQYGGNAHLMTFYGMTNSTIEDCYFNGQTLAASNAYFPSMRDEFHHNTFARDTIVEQPGGLGACQIGWMTDGSAIPSEYNGYNTYTDMRVRVRGLMEYQSTCNNDSWTGGTYLYNNFAWDKCDSMTMQHCTLVSTGGALASSGSAKVAMTVDHNIFYTMIGHTTPIDTSATRGNGNIQYLTNTPGTVNHNLCYSWYTKDSTFAVNAAGGSNRLGVGAWSTWCSSDSNDCDSHWMSPQFADTASWQTFDMTPDSTSVAFDSGTWPDGYAGAIGTYVDRQSPVVDLVGPCPYVETTLPATGAVTLCWTSSDNKAVASVDLAYSLSYAPSTWYSIATGLAANDSYTWTYPGLTTGRVNVRALVTDTSGNTAQDIVIVKKACSDPCGDESPDTYREPIEP